MKRIVFLSLAIVFFFCCCQSDKSPENLQQSGIRKKIVFKIIPRIMPDSETIYIAGNNPAFGGKWNSRGVALEKQPDGSWQTIFFLPEGLHLEFKFTRGLWNNEAIDADGFIYNNFRLDVKNDTTLIIELPNWRDMPEQFIYQTDDLVQVTFTAIPAKVPGSDTVFVTGNHVYLGLWQPGAIPMDKNAAGAWRKTIQVPAGVGLEYKFTRGNFTTEAIFDTAQLRPESFVLPVKNDTAIAIKIPHWKDEFVKAENQSALLAQALDAFNLAWSFRQEVQYDSALSYFQKAVSLYQQMEFWHDLFHCYLNIGDIWLAKFEYERAIVAYRTALRLATDKYLVQHPLPRAVCYIDIGNVYRRKGDLDEAMSYYLKAASVWKDLDRQVKKNSESKSHSGYDLEHFSENYQYLGLIYHLKGEYAKAINCFNEAISIQEPMFGAPHPRIANNLHYLGNAYSEMGDYHTAEKYYNNALEIRQQHFPENHPAIASSYHDFGVLYLEKNDYKKTVGFLEEALSLRLAIYGHKHPDISQSCLSLAELSLQQNEIEKALDYVQKSIVALIPEFNSDDIYDNPPLANSLADNLLLSALSMKAGCFQQLFTLKPREMNDALTALATYELSLDLIDKIRSDYKAEGSKLFLAIKTREIYGNAIQIALKLEKLTKENRYKEKTFLFAERSKSGVLQQTLMDLEARRFADIPEDFLNKERKLRVELAFYETEIQKEKQNPEYQNEERIKEFEYRFLSLKTEYGEFLEKLEKNYPAYFDLKYRAQAASVEQLQGGLDEQTALIEYLVGDSLLYIFVITRDGFKFLSRPLPAFFRPLVTAFYASIKRVLDQEEFLTNSKKLYGLLVEPLESHIASKRKLIILPDDILYYIPFEALVNNKTLVKENAELAQRDYLIGHYEIAYHYSATLYLKNASRKPTGQFAADFMGFAPVFGKAEDNGYILAANSAAFEALSSEGDLQLVTRDGKSLAELKHSEREVRTIVNMFDSQKRNNIGFFHREASEENFKANTGKYRYIHISTHGFMNEEKPQFSGLAFSQPKDSNAVEDGILYSTEAYNLDLNADLVVLSSCESGIGKLVKGEGLMSLTRGFLYSGANNVIVSLWKVFDEHTSELMIELYKHILEGKSYSAALREAKLKMIENPNTAFPASWGSFVLIGH